MQVAVHAYAEATDVAGVRRDLGLIEGKVHEFV
jgi:hypothetical protein